MTARAAITTRLAATSAPMLSPLSPMLLPMFALGLAVTGCGPTTKPTPLGNQATASAGITSVELAPAAPQRGYPSQQHGDVIAIHASGLRVQLTRHGLAHAPALAPDKHTIGWIEFVPDTYRDEPIIRVSALIVFRNGRELARITPTKLAEAEWHFVDGGKRVAVGSAGMHGPTVFELFDAESGNKLEEHGGCKPRPPWTDGLSSRCDVGDD